MGPALTQEQQAIYEMTARFAEECISPFAGKWEEEENIPRSILTHAAELGFGGIYVNEQFGGSGLGRQEAVLIFEALGKACPSVAAFISIHNMSTWMIDMFGSDQIREKYLPKMCSMETVASYCLTEPGAGSDAVALSTKAEQTTNGFKLNGTKSFISGGSYSDLYVVMCRTGDKGVGGISAVIVENNTKGLSFGALEKKMGWKSQPTTEVHFDNVLVPVENLIGREGSGFKYAMKGLDGGRLNIAAAALGGAQTCLEKSLSYMKDRRAFNKTIDSFQALQFRLADMETQLQAARLLLQQAAWKLDNRTSDASKFCAMAKLFVTDAAFRVANDALQLHGGYGYLVEFGIEKFVRDLRVHQILEGTNEIMRVIIARSLLNEQRI